MKKSELVQKFRGLIDSDDPQDKERNKELFKTFVNNVAFVKEIDGVRFVVVRKMYQHLLDGHHTADKTEPEENQPTGEQQRPPVRREETEGCSGQEGGGGGGGGGGAAGGQTSAASEPDGESAEDPSELLSPVQLALQRTRFTDSFRVKRTLNFEIQKDPHGGQFSRVDAVKKPQNKPFALPLRVQPSTTSRVEIRKLKVDPVEPPESPTLGAFRGKKRTPSAESSISSPQLRRAVKKAEEPKDTRVPSAVPLEQAEHEWLVKCASGHWSQVYGLLLRDGQLADKRDFMSGFSALHWAAKCGNSEMLVKIIDLSRQGGVDIDVNAKTHGGYTPLHIAALHHQEYVMAMLVGEFGADPRIRDNCGKKAYHYLHKGVSATTREMLGEPKAQQVQDGARGQDQGPGLEKEEPDLLTDLSKGLHSISRLFQPHTSSHKKKHKQRPGFFSLSDDPAEDREDGSSFRQRIISDAFM